MRARLFTTGVLLILVGIELIVLSETMFSVWELVIVMTSGASTLLLLLIVSTSLMNWLKRRLVEKHALESALISVFFIGALHYGLFLWLMYELITRTTLPLYAVWSIAALAPASILALITAILGS